jgi:hypothetical protein
MNSLHPEILPEPKMLEILAEEIWQVKFTGKKGVGITNFKTSDKYPSLSESSWSISLSSSPNTTPWETSLRSQLHCFCVQDKDFKELIQINKHINPRNHSPVQANKQK